MSFFRSIISFFKKSDAAIVVQNLLVIEAKQGNFQGDPALTAHILVDKVWKEYLPLFDGRYGQRPHKISVAAIAFSFAMRPLTMGQPHFYPYLNCLGKILMEYEKLVIQNQLNEMDDENFEVAIHGYNSAAQTVVESPLSQELDQFMQKQGKEE